MENKLFTPSRHGYILPPEGKSLIEILGELPEEDKRDLLEVLSANDIEDIQNDYRFTARREQLPPPGAWRIWLVLAGRGWGKDLALNTPIPTPTGFTLMEDIQIGDTVFDEGGKPCKVTATFLVHPKEVYEFTFSDGTTLTSGAEHQWVTWTHADRKAYLRSSYEDSTVLPEDWPSWRPKKKLGAKRISEVLVKKALKLQKEEKLSIRKIADRLGVCRTSITPHLKRGEYIEATVATDSNGLGPRIRTTSEIVDTFTYGKHEDTNHSIPVNGNLCVPNKNLPLDPYLFGLWLGDGDSNGSGITGDASNGDLTWYMETFAEGGFPAVKHKATHRAGLKGLKPIIQDLGVYKNKRIPELYLWAGSQQRLELLQGLMDSDGHIRRESNHVEFSTTTENLAYGVVHLARSLGQKPILKKSKAKLKGRVTGPKWRITWRPTVQVFKIPRKAERLSLKGDQYFRNLHKMIVSAKKVPTPKVTKCITVDSKHEMFLAGEGLIPTHNTFCGANYLIHRQIKNLDEYSAIIAPTTNDLWGTCVEGDSGIMSCAPNNFRPTPHKQGKYLTWPNGARTNLFSAEEPERLRGPQHSAIWGDELVAWSQHSDPSEADQRLEYIWSMARFGLRLGTPEMLLTTTPKPRKLIRELVDCAMGKSSTYSVAISSGNTYQNQANLAPEFIEELKKKYEGTRIGEQEIHAKILEDMGGDLWTPELINENRVKSHPMLKRVIIAVDPATGSKEGNDETGIIACGLDENEIAYVLGDHTMKGSPEEWAKKVSNLFVQYGADRVVAEKNQGGDMVETTLRTKNKYLPIKLVHASKGKYVRAEPVAALYEQGKVKHVGEFVALESQMCMMEMGRMKKSPDRADALVWGITELLLGKKGKIKAIGRKKH